MSTDSGPAWNDEMADLARESIWEIAALARLIPDQIPIGAHYAARGMVYRMLKLTDLVGSLLGGDAVREDELDDMHKLVHLENRTADNHA